RSAGRRLARGRPRRRRQDRHADQRPDAAERTSRRRHPHGPARRGAGAPRRPCRLAHALHSLRSRARARRRVADGAALMETIKANDTSISFKRSGKGPPLLLLHGAEADHSMFDAFGPLLSDDFTVIAYDQRDSGGTKNPATPYGFEEL